VPGDSSCRRLGTFQVKTELDKICLIFFSVGSFNTAVCDVAVKILGLGKVLQGHK